MRIVIDARFWSESGVGRYVRNLIYELQRLDDKNEYLILLLKKDFQEVAFNKNFHKILADFKWYGLGEQARLPLLLRKLQPDLVHFPHFNVPVFYHGKYIITIHDLIHQHFQMRRVTTHNPLVYQLKKLSYKKVFSHAVLKALKIITPSDFVKSQLVGEWKIGKEEIVVTYEAVDRAMVNLSKGYKVSDFSKLSQKFKFSNPFIFYVGNAHPHKNVLQLIKAFKILKESFPKLSLVLSGPDNYFWQQVKKESSGKDIIFTGPVTDRELIALYKNAQAFVTASLEEGFGIPILEAMACSCPVISSNRGSLPEVGGQAALYFDPANTEDAVKKISSILENPKLRKELIQKGKERVTLFSWKKLAKQTLEIYQKAGGGS
ncbi:MAG: glycosyltransferase family 1 protein [bacterium]|nr:glycosyltransferase family 1 protein [bacterium]